ncbi:hypothetical protein K438DRAFT_346696 [Mycena galopus ATCC 62051]|nr:hypothetical protein K438DRAFT_346696 [Mycena galopus ATCC 62051]
MKAPRYVVSLPSTTVIEHAFSKHYHCSLFLCLPLWPDLQLVLRQQSMYIKIVAVASPVPGSVGFLFLGCVGRARRPRRPRDLRYSPSPEDTTCAPQTGVKSLQAEVADNTVVRRPRTLPLLPPIPPGTTPAVHKGSRHPPIVFLVLTPSSPSLNSTGYCFSSSSPRISLSPCAQHLRTPARGVLRPAALRELAYLVLSASDCSCHSEGRSLLCERRSRIPSGAGAGHQAGLDSKPTVVRHVPCREASRNTDTILTELKVAAMHPHPCALFRRWIFCNRVSSQVKSTLARIKEGAAHIEEEKG